VNQVQELERAILARAERLANEYRERAERSRDTILRDAAERLRLREQREESIAKALGERTFRQQVQASELKMQSQLDRVRWNLVVDVERRLNERMERYMQDEGAYELIVGLNARDRARLADQWLAIASEVAPNKTIRLAEQPIETLGGMSISSEDKRIRIDHTFEGRLERLRKEIQQVILERLLPGGLETSNVFGG
jgi:V/A-type H+-transporting ATPase subunit E